MRYVFLLVTTLIIFGCTNTGPTTGATKPLDSYVGIARANPAYFELSDRTPYIPIGLNMISPGRAAREGEEQGIAEMDAWMKALSENGGNYVRIWLSNSFWDVEHEKAGIYDEVKARRIDRFLELARKYGLRVKMTIEHFRALTPQESSQSWALKSVYHTSNGGPLDSVRQYITTEEGHSLLLKKLDFYQKRYGDDPIIFGWELWNEMNAMRLPQDSAFFAWNKKMLAELKKTFPKNLAMQSLGSFDNPQVRNTYKTLMSMPGNEVAQVHRYLDLGATMEICHGPMDIICADATRELLDYGSNKPVILAETGAVEPKHSGPSQYYSKDTVGVILHDALFAPFFSGSAGAGMIWHWDQYVAANNLWHHFGRFAQVVKGLDPVAEGLDPVYFETKDLRVYALRGKKTILLWCRDKQNTWQTELKDSVPARTVTGSFLSADELSGHLEFEVLQTFDPWKNEWRDVQVDNRQIILPDFQRSIVVRGKIK
ncbi:MAG TPA: hypothetical protein VFO54_05790 [Chryseosolibacter sp.]|nr:hypothetical protein [Chryseosolibacter sp.]